MSPFLYTLERFYGAGWVSMRDFLLAVLPIVLVYYLLRTAIKWPSVPLLFARIAFTAYFFYLLARAAFPMPASAATLPDMHVWREAVYLLPFQALIDTWKVTGSVAALLSMTDVLRRMGQALLLAVPLGALLALSHPNVRFLGALLRAVLISAVIELASLVLGFALGAFYTVCTVETAILRLVGIVLGYGLASAVRAIINAERQRRARQAEATQVQQEKDTSVHRSIQDVMAL